MSFHVSIWSIKNPVPTIVTFLVLGLFGFFTFTTLGIDQSPNIDVPIVSVTVTQPGAGPTELETQVTRPIEDAIAGLGDIDNIRSTVTEGESTTTIEFDLGTDTDRATNDVRNAIDRIRQDLPQDINEPTVARLEFSGGPIVAYAVSSPQRSVEELSDLVDRRIERELLSIPGVSQVNRWGGVDREVRVDLAPERLLALGITATQVNTQIRDFNINLPGGRAEIGNGEQNVRTVGSAPTVRELQRYQVSLPDGGTAPLTSLGDVRDGFAEARQFALLDGEPVVTFAVLRSTGSTLATVEAGVRKTVARLERELPDDLNFDLVFTDATSIRESYRATIDALVLGCVLTALTVGLFLRDWRVTLITSIALPQSIIPTFLVLQALGYTLNSMTLLALALAVGNLVDDAICTIENIDRHRRMGKTPYQAAMDGAREIGLAVVATTATIVAVFIPVAFMGGIPGQFFQPFGVTVAVSTMFSTLVATTVTPMLSAYWLKPSTGEANGVGCCTPEELGSDPEAFAAISRGPYARLLRWALSHRIVTLILAVMLFIGSLQLIPFIPKGLFSNPDKGLSIATVELPPGAAIADMEATMKRLSADLRQMPEVTSVLARADSVNGGRVYINLVPKDERPDLPLKAFEREARPILQAIPGARLGFQSQGAAGDSKDVSLILKSENATVLERSAEEILQGMRQLPGLVDVTSSASLVRPEVIIEPDVKRAGDLGVSVQAIGRTASLALIGDIESNLAKFDLPDRQIPIRVQLDPAARSDIETLKNLRVPAQDGSLVPIAAVAQLRLGSGPAQIDRFDRSRQISLGANLQGIALGDAVEAIRALPAMRNLPPEVSEQPDGDAEIMRDIFARFLGALALAILAIYAILVLLYNNFLYPLAILVALPLSIGGALLALLIAQKELGLFALIGIVLLMGLVTKNAILLVDFALANQQQGVAQRRALIGAGVSRLRPILMTSVSTVAGMLPIALELGAAGETRSPMAIAVIGGFSTSTLLTLVVVPVLFTFIDNLNHRILRIFSRREAAAAAVRELEDVPQAR
ncbi:MAG: efflux RND transporter permease subunit [Cyanobacteria bacterium J06641_5]